MRPISSQVIIINATAPSFGSLCKNAHTWCSPYSSLRPRILPAAQAFRTGSKDPFRITINRHRRRARPLTPRDAPWPLQAAYRQGSRSHVSDPDSSATSTSLQRVAVRSRLELLLGVSSLRPLALSVTPTIAWSSGGPKPRDGAGHPHSFEHIRSYQRQRARRPSHYPDSSE
jgi:hypothetical protein